MVELPVTLSEEIENSPQKLADLQLALRVVQKVPSRLRAIHVANHPSGNGGGRSVHGSLPSEVNQIMNRLGRPVITKGIIAELESKGRHDTE